MTDKDTLEIKTYAVGFACMEEGAVDSVVVVAVICDQPRNAIFLAHKLHKGRFGVDLDRKNASVIACRDCPARYKRFAGSEFYSKSAIKYLEKVEAEVCVAIKNVRQGLGVLLGIADEIKVKWECLNPELPA